MRLPDDTILITPSGKAKDLLVTEDIVKTENTVRDLIAYGLEKELIGADDVYFATTPPSVFSLAAISIQ